MDEQVHRGASLLKKTWLQIHNNSVRIFIAVLKVNPDPNTRVSQDYDPPWIALNSIATDKTKLFHGQLREVRARPWHPPKKKIKGSDGHLFATRWFVFRQLTGCYKEERWKFWTPCWNAYIRPRKLNECCCWLPCNHCRNWTWIVIEILAYDNRLRSTHRRDLKLCRPGENYWFIIECISSRKCVEVGVQDVGGGPCRRRILSRLPPHRDRRTGRIKCCQ